MPEYFEAFLSAEIQTEKRVGWRKDEWKERARRVNKINKINIAAVVKSSKSKNMKVVRVGIPSVIRLLED